MSKPRDERIPGKRDATALALEKLKAALLAEKRKRHDEMIAAQIPNHPW